MDNRAALKADMKAKHAAYEEARDQYAAAECAAYPLQPGDIIEWIRLKERNRGQVTRLEWIGWKVRVYAKHYIKSGSLGAIERDVEWHHPTKVHP